MRRSSAILFAVVMTGAATTPMSTRSDSTRPAEGCFDTALATAREIVPDSTLIDARLITDGRKTVYEILLMDTLGVLHTVRVDATPSAAPHGRPHKNKGNRPQRHGPPGRGN